MKNVIDFLGELRLNNDRDWFAAHKGEYTAALGEFNAFAGQLIEEIGRFDPTVRGLTLKDCTYRIYRDTRFSADKSPYKTHMGVYVCRGGKKSQFGGYYFHVEPGGEGMNGGGIMSSGIYMPEPAILKSVREEIEDNGDALLTKAEKAAGAGFRLSEDNKLKRLPAGFKPGGRFDELLKLKDVYLEKGFGQDYLLQKDLASAVAADFRQTAEFLAQLNRAVEFALEEM